MTEEAKIDPYDFIKTCDEQKLYFVINFYGGVVWRFAHDMADGRITVSDSWYEDEMKIRKLIEAAAEQTIRFGVEEPLGEVTASGLKTPTEEYWKWFRWWDSYFKTMNPVDYDIFIDKMDNDEDYSMYRPEGEWK
jgi:hypothetical protein